MELLVGKLWMPDLELGCSLWQGEYRGALRRWLRWYDVQGNWVPTEAEMAQQAEQSAEQAQQQVNHERQRRELAEQRAAQERQQRELAEQRVQELTQRLRELGIEP